MKKFMIRENRKPNRFYKYLNINDVIFTTVKNS